jgi:hypothetical protein
MFCWRTFMIEENRVQDRLGNLGSERRVAFATACAQHALLQFQEVWPREHFPPSTSEFIPITLGIVEAIWEFIPRVDRPPDLSGHERQLDLIVGPDYAEVVTWNEGELLNAVLQAMDCLREGGSPRRAVLGAQSAYNAVSKWHCARAHPGKAMTAAQKIEFEKQNPECQAEFHFQLGCLSFLERMGDETPNYALIVASLPPETAILGSKASEA